MSEATTARPGRHGLEQHHAERLAVERREARDGGAAQAGLLLLLRDPPEPLDPRHPPAPQRVAGCGPSPMTHRSASRSRPANASSSTSRPFRRSCRPTKRIAGAADGVTGPVARLATSTPFGTISHSPPKVWVTWRLASSETAVRHGQAAHHRPEAGPEGLVPAVAARARGVEGADRGERGADERGVVGAGRRTARGGGARRARTCATPRWCAGRRPGRLAIGATEPLLGHPGARTDGGDARLGRRTVARERRCGRRPRARAARGRARAPDPAPRRTASASTGTTA